MGSILISHLSILTGFLIVALFFIGSIISYYKTKKVKYLFFLIVASFVSFPLVNLIYKRPTIHESLDYYSNFQELDSKNIAQIEISAIFTNRYPRNEKAILVDSILIGSTYYSLKENNKSSYWIFKDWSMTDMYNLKILTHENKSFHFEIIETKDNRCIMNLLFNKNDKLINIGRFMNHDFKTLELLKKINNIPEPEFD